MLACAFLLRIRASLTVIWMSQVLKRASARNCRMCLKPFNTASWATSSASASLRRIAKAAASPRRSVRADQLIKKLVLAGQDALDQHRFVESFGWTFQRNHH